MGAEWPTYGSYAFLFMQCLYFPTAFAEPISSVGFEVSVISELGLASLSGPFFGSLLTK